MIANFPLGKCIGKRFYIKLTYKNTVLGYRIFFS